MKKLLLVNIILLQIKKNVVRVNVIFLFLITNYSPFFAQVIINQTQVNVQQKQTNININNYPPVKTQTKNNDTYVSPVDAAMQKAEWETQRKNIGTNYGYTLTDAQTKLIEANYWKKSRIAQYSNLPRYYAISNCNLRTGSGTNYPILTEVEANDYVFVIDTEDQYSISGPTKFWKVFYPAKDQVGYIYKSSLKSDPKK